MNNMDLLAGILLTAWWGILILGFITFLVCFFNEKILKKISLTRLEKYSIIFLSVMLIWMVINMFILGLSKNNVKPKSQCDCKCNCYELNNSEFKYLDRTCINEDQK